MAPYFILKSRVHMQNHLGSLKQQDMQFNDMNPLLSA